MNKNNIEVVKTSEISNTNNAEMTAYEQLSNQQKQRANYLKSIIGDHGVALVKQLDSRGRNSWPIVYKKVVNIQKASYDDQRYYSAVCDNFDVDNIYTSAEIISIVGQIRQDLGLEPYLVNLKSNCENDFFNLFIVKDIYETEDGDKKKGKLQGYKPVLCIKPEDI